MGKLKLEELKASKLSAKLVKNANLIKGGALAADCHNGNGKDTIKVGCDRLTGSCTGMSGF